MAQGQGRISRWTEWRSCYVIIDGLKEIIEHIFCFQFRIFFPTLTFKYSGSFIVFSLNLYPIYFYFCNYLDYSIFIFTHWHCLSVTLAQIHIYIRTHANAWIAIRCLSNCQWINQSLIANSDYKLLLIFLWTLKDSYVIFQRRETSLFIYVK